MILSFAKKYKDGNYTNFKRKIQTGEKPHSFRDGGRWKPGMKIHFWEGAPYSKKYGGHPFFIDYDFAAKWEALDNLHKDQKTINLPLVYAVEKFTFDFSFRKLTIGKVGFKFPGILIDSSGIEEIAKRDGFNNVEDFIGYFEIASKGACSYSGQVVHWTSEYIYNPETASIYDV